jgi:hypothetical protein
MDDLICHGVPKSGGRVAKEVELVFLTARARLNNIQKEWVMEHASAGIDWQWVMTLALYHGVFPLVGRTLIEIGPAIIQKDVLSVWAGQIQKIASANLRKTAELLRLTRLLRSHDIPILHFKGPVLAAQAFHDLTLRTFADLDILIHEEHACRARDLILANGYRMTLSPEGEAFHLRQSYWLGFRHESGGFNIDLHWKLADRYFCFEPDIATLWANARAVRVMDTDVLTFGPEDGVLVLATHGFKHAYSRLKWICDLCEWIHVHPDLNWPSIREEARRLHIERILSISLTLVDSYDDRVVPESIVREMRADPRVMALTRRVWDAIFFNERPIEGVRANMFHILGRERRRDILRYIRSEVMRHVKRVIIPNEKDRAVVALPRSLGFLYFAVRPLRLAVRHTRGTWQGLKTRETRWRDGNAP